VIIGVAHKNNPSQKASLLRDVLKQAGFDTHFADFGGMAENDYELIVGYK
jgi:hypothetical protein